jgi:hypothetical protein
MEAFPSVNASLDCPVMVCCPHCGHEYSGDPDCSLPILVICHVCPHEFRVSCTTETLVLPNSYEIKDHKLILSDGTFVDLPSDFKLEDWHCTFRANGIGASFVFKNIRNGQEIVLPARQDQTINEIAADIEKKLSEKWREDGDYAQEFFERTV